MAREELGDEGAYLFAIRQVDAKGLDGVIARGDVDVLAHGLRIVRIPTCEDDGRTEIHQTEGDLTTNPTIGASNNACRAGSTSGS